MRVRENEGTATQAGASIHGKRILIVEDSLMVAMVLTDALSEHGCEAVGPVSRTAKALDLIRHEPIDGAVLDINLRGETVYPIAEELQRRGIPFLFATGYDKTAVLPERFSGFPVIQKPFRMDELGAIFRRTFA